MYQLQNNSILPCDCDFEPVPHQHGPAFGVQEYEEDRDPYVATPPIPTVFSINISNCKLKHVNIVFRKRLMVPRKNEGNESRPEIKPSGTQPVPPHSGPTYTSQRVGEGYLQARSLPPEHHSTKHQAVLLFTMKIFSKSIEG